MQGILKVSEGRLQIRSSDYGITDLSNMM